MIGFLDIANKQGNDAYAKSIRVAADYCATEEIRIDTPLPYWSPNWNAFHDEVESMLENEISDSKVAIWETMHEMYCHGLTLLDCI